MPGEAAYDAAAPSFDRYRALPDGVAPAIRAAVLSSIGEMRPPRLLDLGAGTGRTGWPFLVADDNYVGVDLSLGMLREFMLRTGASSDNAPRLAQANGEHLPFRDATFDAVLLMQVLSAARDGRRLVAEAGRVLHPDGCLIVGRTVAPDDGVDAEMKQHLAESLRATGIEPYWKKSSDDALNWLTRKACENRTVTAAAWTAERTPRRFLQRHSSGARFSVLPASVKDATMLHLRDWAIARFGSLDTKFAEAFRFELTICHLSQDSRNE